MRQLGAFSHSSLAFMQCLGGTSSRRVRYCLYMGRVCLKFSGAEELKRLLEKIGDEDFGGMSIEFDGKEEFLEVASQAVLQLMAARPCGKIDEERVYEAVKAIVEDKIRKGESYFMMQDVYAAICGRPLRVYANPQDHKIALKLRRAVKRWLPRIEKELRVRFEEGIITQYEGRAGKFRVFKIVAAERRE